MIDKLLRLPKVLRGKDFFCRKDINCPAVTYGNKNAAWTINPELLGKNSIVYSFGVGEDISFDVAMIQNHKVLLFAFDPTPKSINWLQLQPLPENFVFLPIGIAAYDGIARFALPENPDFVSASIVGQTSIRGFFEAEVKRLSTIMKQLSHEKIDILKMDIEGAEFDVIDDILDSNVEIKQILIEFHHRFPEIGIAKAKETIRKLRKAGYKVFSISANGEEISFIKQIK